MNKLNMIYEGKAKRVYTTEQEDLYIMEFKDDATAFNGEKKGQIGNKGAMNNAISESLYKILEEKGIPTHFVERMNERDTLVKAVTILPIEVLVRNVAAGSLTQRLGIPEGTELPMTILEFCYKNDAFGDPQINEYHIEAMALATKAQVEKIKEYALKVNDILRPLFLSKGVKLIDFKLEFGVHKGEVILADEISPDTCRFWDAVTNEKMDKDRFRRDLGNIEEGYQEILSRLSGGNNA